MNPKPQLDSDGLFPWRFFVRAVNAVFHLRILLTIAAAVLVAGIGDGVIGSLTGFSAKEQPEAALPTDAAQLAKAALLGPVDYWRQVTAPFWNTPSEPAHAGIGVWRVLVSFFAGGVVARSVAMSLTHREAPTTRELVRRSLKSWPGALAVAACLLLLAGALLLPLLLHAWMLASPWLELFSAVLLPIPLLLTLSSALLLVCSAIGWPLLVAAGVVERADPFDATSRALAYATQRPTHLAAYFLVALVVGAPVGVLVETIALVGIGMSDATLSHAYPASGPTARQMAHAWCAGLFGLLPRAYYAAYFWSASTAIYLLLRRDIDDVQVDDLDDEA